MEKRSEREKESEGKGERVSERARKDKLVY